MTINEAYTKNRVVLGTISELLVSHSKKEIDDSTFVKKVRELILL